MRAERLHSAFARLVSALSAAVWMFLSSSCFFVHFVVHRAFRPSRGSERRNTLKARKTPEMPEEWLTRRRGEHGGREEAPRGYAENVEAAPGQASLLLLSVPPCDNLLQPRISARRSEPDPERPNLRRYYRQRCQGSRHVAIPRLIVKATDAIYSWPLPVAARGRP